jgi:hypothetical protein
MVMTWDRKQKVNIEEAVQYLKSKGRKISVGRMYNIIAAGGGPRREKKGRSWVFVIEDLDAWDRGETETFQAHQ